jgi:hypothetical protein
VQQREGVATTTRTVWDRRMEAHKAAQLAMADIVEALHPRHGILSISEMSRLSGVSRQDIYKTFNHGAKKPRA